MKTSKAVSKPLSNTITKQINISETCENFVVNFLEKHLPRSDIKVISNELKKTFIFDKVKSRVRKQKSRKRSFLTTRKQKKIAGNSVRMRNDLKYHELLPLNKLWLEYIQQALGFQNYTNLPTSSIDHRWDMVNQRLMKADYHGAKIRIIKSKCPTLVGIEGIIIQDTKNTFEIISDDNVVRTIPKHTVVIRIYLIRGYLEVLGKKICIRPAERAVKKFKANHIFEL